MKTWRWMALALVMPFAWPGIALGQGFEGVIEQRTAEFDEEALYDVLFADAYDEPEFETEVEWFRYMADKLFAVPVDRLIGSGSGDVEEITMYVKGSWVRYEPSGDPSGSYMVINAETSTTRLVMPSERAYIEYSMDDAQAMADDATRRAEEMMAEMGLDPEELARQAAELEEDMEEYEDEMGLRFEPSVRSLDRTEEVNGMRASAFHAEAGREIAIGWCAEDVTGMVGTMKDLVAQVEQWSGEETEAEEGPSAEDLLCEDRLPVRTQVLSSGGMAMALFYSVSDFLSIERTAVADDRFEVPAGYTKRSLSDMWR